MRARLVTWARALAALGVVILGCLALIALAQTDPPGATATTADALSANPSNCAAGKKGGGIAADGTAEDCSGGRGEMYLKDLDGGTNDWTASGTTFEKMTAFATDGVVEGSVSASAANDELTFAEADVCEVRFKVGFSGTGNRTIQCCIFAGPDGSEVETHVCLPRALGTGGDVGAMGSAFGILSLSADDRAELHCKTDNASTTLDFWQLSVGAHC